MSHRHMLGMMRQLGRGTEGAANDPALRGASRLPPLGPTAVKPREVADWPTGFPEEEKPRTRLMPLNFQEITGNELRPQTFAGMVGQARLKPLLEELVAVAKAQERPLDHMLLTGRAGTGKTTIAIVMANELHTDIYVLQAPVTQDTLEELAEVAQDRDIVFIDEIHLQSRPAERRGVSATPGSEVFLSILEDKRLTTETGTVEFPDVTLVGATTDAGLLPSPFLSRWPLQPRLDPYTISDMIVLAQANAKALGLEINSEAAKIFAHAARETPRIINRYTRNARSLGAKTIDFDLAVRVVADLNSTTWDGLDSYMQEMLKFLLRSRHENRKGEVTYRASVASIATALGFSRDQKRVALEVEPLLIERALVGVGPTGRYLTDAGIQRATEL